MENEKKTPPTVTVTNNTNTGNIMILEGARILDALNIRKEDADGARIRMLRFFCQTRGILHACLDDLRLDGKRIPIIEPEEDTQGFAMQVKVDIPITWESAITFFVPAKTSVDVAFWDMPKVVKAKNMRPAQISVRNESNLAQTTTIEGAAILIQLHKNTAKILTIRTPGFNIVDAQFCVDGKEHGFINFPDRKEEIDTLINLFPDTKLSFLLPGKTQVDLTFYEAADELRGNDWMKQNNPNLRLMGMERWVEQGKQCQSLEELNEWLALEEENIEDKKFLTVLDRGVVRFFYGSYRIKANCIKEEEEEITPP